MDFGIKFALLALGALFKVLHWSRMGPCYPHQYEFFSPGKEGNKIILQKWNLVLVK